MRLLAICASFSCGLKIQVQAGARSDRCPAGASQVLKTGADGTAQGAKGTFQGCVAPGGDGTLPQRNSEVEMKMVKSLLLGSAAGVVAVAGAQAADLPVKAKPVEYVKICSLYGDGKTFHHL